MNNVTLVGRLTRDVELKTVGQGTEMASFTIAVDRRFKNQRGEREADFIRCVAWKQTASFVSKHFAKGDKLGVIGEIQTRNFDGQDGKKVYITEVKVDQVHFVDSKGSQAGYNGSNRGESTTRERSNSWGRSTEPNSKKRTESNPSEDFALPFDV